ncbi:hypothetical protein B484DRAFT_305888, partial [Ochromonadaceae sp. CCMP2298]
YTGQMRGGKHNGFGKASWATGIYEGYDGQWKDDKRHGHGIAKWYAGDIYAGQWEEGWKQGQFVY